MTGFKICLVASTLGIVAESIVPIETGQKLAGMTPTGILGVVAVSSILALVYIYKAREKDEQKHGDEMKQMIRENTAASQGVKDVMQDVKLALVNCKQAQDAARR